VIRTPAEPTATFADDPLRMLRAIRFAARFGFTIEPATWAGIVSSATRLEIVSRERIRDEFQKILMTPRAADGLELLRESGLLVQFAPELLEMVGVEQNEFHAYPVWEHTLNALRALPAGADLIVRLATLLHDIGKPRTKTVDSADGRVHFYHHQDVGAQMAREILRRLKCSNDLIAAVTLLVQDHMRIGEYKPSWSDSAVRRLIRNLGPNLDRLFEIHAADVAALADDHRDTRRARELRRRIDDIQSRQDIVALQPPLGGKEIMQILGIEPGPAVRELKDYLTMEVVDGRLDPGDVHDPTHPR